ncbi:B12-binding domain-containing protein [Tuwongella immobilis]|uniref:B12-binding domain-containing protein n=1 Tax=Tuwongella immobilis TaxID=692036 RepID=A0A6C2YK25_9BACT|nr:B12-binding domain-containing protein [Tuwongella immobilis]VIP01928.1 dna binding domain excisionase family : Uncharacterized protein OS=Planctomyces maris DSM 8797 GN=PM8797T_03414 PE=4 SV=1: MerR: B12-binding_2 [Tuwongella immobilis]VTR99872.1 dna binding domain excisionase family : Uncharacterized protein OS=Planctomyces maris DSM 8797 GN=PM8797T_03414 PE=4 SV=1: MerR: B12-binding_2 [Tuwongella immobilis]
MNRLPVPDDPNGSEPQYVSTAQVARALGVSVTTVKRWVDESILPAHRTPGGHRKLLINDVLRLVREGSFPHADLGQLQIPRMPVEESDPRALSKQLTDALLASDSEAVRSLIHGAYRNGVSIEFLADRIIGPAMAYVGHQWEAGQIGIMHEHRSTQACVGALYELRGMLRMQAVDANRPVAICGAPEHDHYTMPSLLAKLVLLDAGWNAINLGPNTPMSAFLDAMHLYKPTLIVVSISYLPDPHQFLQKYSEFYRQAEQLGIPVAVGGRGLTETLRVNMPYTTFGDGLTHLSAFARTLYRRPQRPRRGRPPGSTRRNDLGGIDDDGMDGDD